jgi:hypothetical protein
MDDDITRNYHGGNPQSRAANRRTDKLRDSARIQNYLYPLGLRGATCDEAIVATGIEHMTCSARFSDLKKAKVIFETGEQRLTRKGCWAAVCALTIFKPAERGTATEATVTIEPVQRGLFD